MATILIFSATAHGNLFPLLPGLSDLERRGHDVHVRVPGKHVELIRQAGYAAEASGISIDDFERAVAQLDPDAVAIDAHNYRVMTWADVMGIPSCGIGMVPRVARRSLLRGRAPSERFAAAIEELLPPEARGAREMFADPDSPETRYSHKIPVFA